MITDGDTLPRDGPLTKQWTAVESKIKLDIGDHFATAERAEIYAKHKRVLRAAFLSGAALGVREMVQAMNNEDTSALKALCDDALAIHAHACMVNTLHAASASAEKSYPSREAAREENPCPLREAPGNAATAAPTGPGGGWRGWLARFRL